MKLKPPEKNTMPLNLSDFTVLCDLEARLRLVTPEQVASAERRLVKIEPGEKSYGRVSDTTRLLWALAAELRGVTMKEEAEVILATDDMIAKDHQELAIIADQMEDLARELMWTQARADTGCWTKESVGIRAGWILVTVPMTKGDQISTLLGGMFRLPPGS
jgi:hypothetical protein